jgi:hypothetical protein
VQSNNVTGGSSWINQGNLTNWAFSNTSYIPDNNAGEVYQIILNITDNLGNWNLTYCYIFVDNTPPSGSQDLITSQPQIGSIIWANGSAFDLGIGLASVVVQSNNVTGGASFSVNRGNLTNWAFSNTSYIPDNNPGEVFEIIINITDNLGNGNLTYCHFFVDNTPPSAVAGVYLSLTQNSSVIWLNGTASDSGIGLLSAYIYPSGGNSSTSWSNNQNTTESWAFFNNASIFDNNYDEVYEVKLNISDIVGNYFNLSVYFRVDTTEPSNITDLYDLGTRLTDDFIQLRWTPPTDNSSIMYEIWRKTANGTWQVIFTTPFNATYYNDYNLDNGIYEYRIRPIDEAGNYGNFSNIIIVEIDTKDEISLPYIPIREDTTWIILLLIGLIVGSIVIIIIYKKTEPSEPEILKPVIKQPISKKEIIPLFEALETSKTKIQPQEPIKEQISPPLKLPEKESSTIDRIGEIKETLYYLCPTCNQVYATTMAGDYKCVQCQTNLEFQKKVTILSKDGKIQFSSKDRGFIYYCSNCKRYFKVPIKGRHKCTVCNNILKEYQS